MQHRTNKKALRLVLHVCQMQVYINNAIDITGRLANILQNSDYVIFIKNVYQTTKLSCAKNVNSISEFV